MKFPNTVRENGTVYIWNSGKSHTIKKAVKQSTSLNCECVNIKHETDGEIFRLRIFDATKPISLTLSFKRESNVHKCIKKAKNNR